MRITVITLFPQMINSFINESIVKRAQDKKQVEIEIVNLRDFATDNYGSVDDKPYGGGTGMVLRADILSSALKKVKSDASHVALTSAKGAPYNQKKALQFATLEHLIIIVGRYEGVDERILSQVQEEVSLGDFVMTGGEITAAAIIDSVTRLLPGVLKQDNATVIESFAEYDVDTLISVCGNHDELSALKEKGIKKVKLLEFPQYTRPEEFEGKKVPEVLLSGNHAEIEKWKLRESFAQTLQKRPDLLKRD
jgi:tRNA (guanine37-N1)-methyltransferase